jgi:hypothetical protein
MRQTQHFGVLEKKLLFPLYRNCSRISPSPLGEGTGEAFSHYCLTCGRCAQDEYMNSNTGISPIIYLLWLLFFLRKLEADSFSIGRNTFAFGHFLEEGSSFVFRVYSYIHRRLVPTNGIHILLTNIFAIALHFKRKVAFYKSVQIRVIRA